MPLLVEILTLLIAVYFGANGCGENGPLLFVISGLGLLMTVILLPIVE